MLNYGFVLPNNEKNDLEFMAKYDENDKLLKEKLEFVGNDSMVRLCKIMQNFPEECNLDFLGYIRFILLDDIAVLDKLKDLHSKKGKIFL